jgi:CRP/FNR family transcriptional regulator, cyclic AMP receptor protein
MNSAIWFFDNVDVFQILCPHKYAEHNKTHNFSLYKKNDVVFTEEDIADKVFLINEGKVKIGYVTEEGDEIITAILTKGQIFGEKAILGEETRNEFAIATEKNTSICVITLDVMKEMLKNNNDFSLRIYKFIGFKFRKLERRMQLLLFKDARTRLLEFIKDLSEEYGYKNAITGDQVIRHPYRQEDIAKLIGITRPTMNVLLNELQKENILKFDRKEIILKKEYA